MAASPFNRQRRRAIAAMAASSLYPLLAAAASRPARSIDLIGAPSNLGLRPPRPGHAPGAWRAPGVLRDLGIGRRLGARDRGDVACPSYDPEPDPVTHFRNGAALPGFSRALAAKVGESLDRGSFPLVLGGDCSILLGSALALRRRGRYGLLFVDGHPDFYTALEPDPRTAAGVDLALVTGHGPSELTDLDGLQPCLRAADTAVVAHREYADEPGYSFAEFRASGISPWPLEVLRQHGVGDVMREVLALVENPQLAGFWIHLDVDVLDPKIMPAVDSPDPGGLQWGELRALLRLALASPRCVGMELTIYDPELDPGRRFGKALVDLLADAFAT